MLIPVILSEPSKIAEVITTAGGSFEIEFPIKDKDTSGNYFYKIGGDDFETPYSGTFYYASAYDKNKVTESVNAVVASAELTDEEKVSEIAKIITAAEEKLLLNSEIYKTVGAEKIAKLILNECRDYEIDSTDAAVELKQKIDIASVVAAYNDSLITLLADTDLNLINKDIYSFADFDKISGTTSYCAYENLSYEAREA